MSNAPPPPSGSSPPRQQPRQPFIYTPRRFPLLSTSVVFARRLWWAPSPPRSQIWFPMRQLCSSTTPPLVSHRRSARFGRGRPPTSSWGEVTYFEDLGQKAKGRLPWPGWPGSHCGLSPLQECCFSFSSRIYSIQFSNIVQTLENYWNLNKFDKIVSSIPYFEFEHNLWNNFFK
jgi:hypothetical protein